MFAWSLLLLVSAPALPPEETQSAGPPAVAEVREAVQRAIPYIEEQGVWWMEAKECSSCHRASNMVWSLREARRGGFTVSEELDAWVRWTIDDSLMVKKDDGTISGLGNKEGVAQLLIALGPAAAGEAEAAEFRGQLAALLRQDQLENGSWKPGGQLPSQKRPAAETAATTSQWLALALLNEGASAEEDAVLAKALAHAEQNLKAVSTEWFALRLLLAVERNDAAARARFITALRARQQADGGWGWLTADPSDALGTGLALYALARAGVPRDDATVARGQQFLVSTQRDDGAWLVHGTKAGKKDREQETAVYWGATWAVLGLTAGLPVE